MAIEIFPNKIQFNNYSLEFTPTGIGTNSFGVLRGDFFANQAFSSPMYGGVAGFCATGLSIPQGSLQHADRFPFAVDSNSVNFINTQVARIGHSGHSSQIHGYLTGGYASPSNPEGRYNTISKYPFSVNVGSTGVGVLSRDVGNAGGHSSPEQGFVSGGIGDIPSPLVVNTIDKFPFATDTNSTDHGDLSAARSLPTGNSSITHGYSSGGRLAPENTVETNIIDKFPFASNTVASDVGDLTTVRSFATGQSSSTHGYNSGGSAPLAVAGTYPLVNIIERFPFASDTNSSDVGDIVQPKSLTAGQSSTTHGYITGGFVIPGVAPSTYVNTIEKFPFASASTNTSDVGDLTIPKNHSTGSQD